MQCLLPFRWKVRDANFFISRSDVGFHCLAWSSTFIDLYLIICVNMVVYQWLAVDGSIVIVWKNKTIKRGTVDKFLTSLAGRLIYLVELKSGNQGKRKKERMIPCLLMLMILPWKLDFAAILLNANKKYKLFDFLCFCHCPFLLKGIVCQWPVLPSVFVCVRLFRRQFWKLYQISRKDLYALARMGSDLGKSEWAHRLGNRSWISCD